MDIRNFYKEIVIFIIFFSSIASLIFSGLSLEKSITYPNVVSGLFLSELQKSNVVSAVLVTAKSIFFEVVLPLLPFLILMSSGFASVLYFKPDNKKLALTLVAVAVFSLLLSHAIVIFFICLGLFVLVLPIDFIEREGFRNGYSFSSQMMKYLIILISIGLFFSIYLVPDFEEKSKNQIISGITSVIPSANEMSIIQKDAAKDFITQAAAGVSNNIKNAYSSLNETMLNQCKDVISSVDIGIENYKNSIISEIDKGNITTIDLKNQISQMSIISSLAKAYPLTAAFMFLFLLEFLKPFISLVGGLVYYILEKGKI